MDALDGAARHGKLGCGFPGLVAAETKRRIGWTPPRIAGTLAHITQLTQLLVCPVTKGPLEFDRDKQELISRSARLAYPVRDGIPVLLENEARVLSDAELEG